MKRDLDLVRQILIYVEEEFDPADTVLDMARDDVPDVLLENHSEAEVLRHVEILWQSGLIDVRLPDGKNDVARDINGRIYAIPIKGMTAEGHDFVAEIRDDTV